MRPSSNYATPAKRARTTPSKYGGKKKALKRYVKRMPSVVSLGRQAFPKQLSNTLKYATAVTFSLTAGAATPYAFSCNGLYDPDISGTGHQPLYFDQLMAIYNHYTVRSSRCKVSSVGLYFNAATTVQMCIDDDATGPTTMSSMAERPGAVSAFFNPIIENPYPLRKAWNCRANFGGNPLSDPELQGTAGTNPTEQQYFQILVGNDTGINQTVTLYIEIEYDAVFNELKTIATS